MDSFLLPARERSLSASRWPFALSASADRDRVCRRSYPVAVFALLLVLSTLLPCARAQDADGDNPTGPSGAYNSQVTTAGQYDPYTRNAKRSVTDLVVPNSPLALTRNYNSRQMVVDNDLTVLGDGSKWRHSYQWTRAIAEKLPDGQGGFYPVAYNVAYPDGSVVTFRSYRTNSPENNSGYWHGPMGTEDRLYIPTGGSNPPATLLLSDGSQVFFPGGSMYPESMTDPNKAVTKFEYTVGAAPGYLAKVTEPGGRWLSFSYTTYQYPNGSLWALLTGAQASTGQTVTYNYTTFGSHSVGGPTPYLVLDNVVYNYEPRIANPSVAVSAAYTYQNNGSSVPDLLTAIDPHYAGAMVNIRYKYYSPGYVQEEQNYNNSQPVSSLARDDGPGNYSVETRGDKASGNTAITRAFTYGPRTFTPPNQAQVSSNARKAQLSMVTDFQGNTSYLTYAGSFVQATYDAKGNKTTYEREFLVGKIKAVNLPDGRRRTSDFRGIDGSTTNATPTYPYYLAKTTDERGYSVVYNRYSNTGLVYQVDYPDTGHEFYQYQGFNGPNGAFYKVSLYQNQRGGQITYGYDETDVNHGGSGNGHVGLLTSVTRHYAVGTQTAHERTVLYYDAYDRLIKSIDPLSHQTLFEYNPRHQLTKTTYHDNIYVAFAYDDYGNRYSVEDELHRVTATTYDEYRRPWSVTTPVNAPQADGTIVPSRYVKFAYERRDNTDALIGDAFSHTSAAWSATWLPSKKGTQRIFSKNGWLTDQYDGMSIYDASFPIVPTPGDSMTHTTVDYDVVGQPLKSTDPQGMETNFTYDSSNRLLTAVDPLGGANHTTTYAYYGPNTTVGAMPAAGLLNQVTGPGTDASYAATATTVCSGYNSMARPTSTTDPKGNVFKSDYNLAGDQTRQTDGGQLTSTPSAHKTDYDYDQLGRKITCLYPDGTTERWTYDAAGNVATYTTRALQVCFYQYDARNRGTYSSWSGASVPSSITTEYYPDSRVKRVANASADLYFTYDEAGALIQEARSSTGALATRFTHDADGNVDSLTYPNGNRPCYRYDSQQRPRQLYAGSTIFSDYSYAGSRLTHRTLPFPRIHTQYGYQYNGRINDVWSYHYNPANGSYLKNVRRHAYGYAPDGQLSWANREYDGTAPDGTIPAGSAASGSLLENGRGDVYDYWPDGSLHYGARDVALSGGWPGEFSATADSRAADAQVSYAGATASTYGFGYDYDAAGNRTLADQMGQARIYYGDNPARPGQNQYAYSTYDANGNTTDSVVGATYQYDAQHQLTGVQVNGTLVAAFGYDGLGRLLAQNVYGVATSYFYAGGQRIEERDGYNNALRYLYFFEAPGGDGLLWREGIDASSNGAWRRLWYLTDLMGNTTQVADDAGNIIEQYLYDPYGTPTVYTAQGWPQAGNASQVDNRYLFKSNGAYVWFPQLGLYYCRARFYLPQHGRWLQPDPVGQAGGLNLYAYCGNDPVNGADPSGLAQPGDTEKSRQVEGEGNVGPVPGSPTAERIIVTGESWLQSWWNRNLENLKALFGIGSGSGPDRSEMLHAPSLSQQNAITDLDYARFMHSGGNNAVLFNHQREQMSVVRERAVAGEKAAANAGIGALIILRNLSTASSAPLWDTSITKPGSALTNIATNVTATELRAALTAEGYTLARQTMGSNGPVAVYTNGVNSVTIYTATSTGSASAQVFAAGNALAKVRLGGP